MAIASRHTGKYVLQEDIRIDELIEFLNRKGFSMINLVDLDMWTFKEMYRMSERPVYTTGAFTSPYNSWIRFGKGADEPLFFWRLEYLDCGAMWDMETIDGRKEFESFQEFKDYLKEHFGW